MNDEQAALTIAQLFIVHLLRAPLLKAFTI